jgi:hypothetical protein
LFVASEGVTSEARALASAVETDSRYSANSMLRGQLRGVVSKDSEAENAIWQSIYI